jgi:hypothetical protein
LSLTDKIHIFVNEMHLTSIEEARFEVTMKLR